MMQIDQSSKEVNETILLTEAKLDTAERQDQRAEREAAERYRLSSMLYRKERERTEADRMAQMQLEKHSEFSTRVLILTHQADQMPQRFKRQPSSSSSVTTTTRLPTGKLVHNGTAPQVNGSPNPKTSDGGSLKVVLVCSGSLES